MRDSNAGWGEKAMLDRGRECRTHALKATAGIEKVGGGIRSVLPRIQGDQHVTRHGEKTGE